LTASAVVHARAGHRREALHRLREAIEHAHREADVPFLMGGTVAALAIYDTPGWNEAIGELAGILTRSKYAHLNVGPLMARYRTPEALTRLQAGIPRDTFEQAAERGAAMDADEVAAFLLASIDEAMLEISDA
jgi:hypothetical protein